jgi:carnitine O-acetyltransferase
MLRFQRNLPRLPVPALADTCELYLRLARPLLSEREYEATRRAAADFVRPGGPGEALQSRLLRWSTTSAPDNWLEPFWDDWYLCDDAPLVVNVSPGFALAGGTRAQLARAAGLLAAAVRLQRLITSEELEPDLDGDAPRCMREYTRLFASTRVPGTTRDLLTQHADSRHVIVLHREHVFTLDVLDPGGRPFGAGELSRALQQIVDESQSAARSLGVLTTAGRRSWADTRETHLVRGPAPTRELLDAVERAILVLVLEDGEPPRQPRTSEAARLFLHGDVRNRWFDKSIQLVVARNGVAGFCMEHSGFDGSTALRLAEYLVGNEEPAAPSALGERRAIPRRLDYVATEPLAEAIASAQRDVDAILRRTDLVVLDFAALGKRSIVRHGVSPDGFVQMAFQLAYSTLTGETASTYESVDTKHFLHGRTEAMRVVSDESVAFVRALRANGRARANAAGLVRAAIERHVATLARCKEGRGVDRHLLGLHRMLEPGEELPALFADRGYATLTRSVLSTSALPSSPGVALTCFGPVVDEGLGLSYTIHADSVCCVVTSFHGLADDFAAELASSLEEMDALLARDGST